MDIVKTRAAKSGDDVTVTPDQIKVSSGPAFSFGIKRGDGLKLPVNLPALIDQVFVPPQAPKWLKSLAQDIIRPVMPDLQVQQPVANPTVQMFAKQ